MKTAATRNRYSRIWELVVLTALAACGSDPKTVTGTNTNAFPSESTESYVQATAIRQGDYLFVVDFSYSMNSKVSSLANSLDYFAQNLTSENIDYRIGFVRGNIHGTASTNSEIKSWTPSSFISLIPSPMQYDSLIDKVQQDILNEVGQPLQQNRNVLLEAGAKTLSAKSSSFLRKAAQLVMVFVSDGDDDSDDFTSAYGHSTDVSYYVNKFKSAKVDPGYVSARAIVGGVDGCPLQNSYDTAGTRLRNVAKQVDATAPNAYCITNTFNDNLADLARNVTKPVGRFALENPSLSGTITVRVDGTVVPAAGNWTYNSATNEIVFVSGKEPGPSQSVSIHYEVPFILSDLPKVNTIEVKIGNSVIPKSDSNGWSYIASENRIVLNGSAKPSSAVTVVINYDIQ